MKFHFEDEQEDINLLEDDELEFTETSQIRESFNSSIFRTDIDEFNTDSRDPLNKQVDDLINMFLDTSQFRKSIEKYMKMYMNYPEDTMGYNHYSGYALLAACKDLGLSVPSLNPKEKVN